MQGCCLWCCPSICPAADHKPMSPFLYREGFVRKGNPHAFQLCWDTQWDRDFQAKNRKIFGLICFPCDDIALRLICTVLWIIHTCGSDGHSACHSKLCKMKQHEATVEQKDVEVSLFIEKYCHLCRKLIPLQHPNLKNCIKNTEKNILL